MLVYLTSWANGTCLKWGGLGFNLTRCPMLQISPLPPTYLSNLHCSTIQARQKKNLWVSLCSGFHTTEFLSTPPMISLNLQMRWPSWALSKTMIRQPTEELEALNNFCQDNNLSFTVSKTKEMIVDYRKQQDTSPSTSVVLRLKGSAVSSSLVWTLLRILP